MEVSDKTNDWVFGSMPHLQQRSLKRRAVDAPDSWWVGLTREQFAAKVIAEQSRMAGSNSADQLDGLQGIAWDVRGRASVTRSAA